MRNIEKASERVREILYFADMNFRTRVEYTDRENDHWRVLLCDLPTLGYEGRIYVGLSPTLQRGNGRWCSPKFTTFREGLLKGRDMCIHIYHPGELPGVIAKREGNKIKPDFRRGCLVDDVVSADAPDCYQEIPHVFTPANVLLMVQGLPLEDLKLWRPSANSLAARGGV